MPAMVGGTPALPSRLPVLSSAALFCCPRRRVDCVVLPDGTPDNHVELAAQLQGVHVFVSGALHNR